MDPCIAVGRKFDPLVISDLHYKQTPSPRQAPPLSTFGTPLEPSSSLIFKFQNSISIYSQYGPCDVLSSRMLGPLTGTEAPVGLNFAPGEPHADQK